MFPKTFGAYVHIYVTRFAIEVLKHDAFSASDFQKRSSGKMSSALDPAKPNPTHPRFTQQVYR